MFSLCNFIQIFFKIYFPSSSYITRVYSPQRIIFSIQFFFKIFNYVISEESHTQHLSSYVRNVKTAAIPSARTTTHVDSQTGPCNLKQDKQKYIFLSTISVIRRRRTYMTKHVKSHQKTLVKFTVCYRIAHRYEVELSSPPFALPSAALHAISSAARKDARF